MLSAHHGFDPVGRKMFGSLWGGWVGQDPTSGQSNPTGLHRTSVPSQQNSLQILIPVQVSLLTSVDQSELFIVPYTFRAVFTIFMGSIDT